MKPHYTTFEESPYSNQLVSIRVFCKDNPKRIEHLENNQKEISSLAKTMYRDGLIAEKAYLDGLRFQKMNEMNILHCTIMASFERYVSGSDAFSVHYDAILQAHEQYRENILRIQALHDRTFINDLLEEQLEARTRK